MGKIKSWEREESEIGEVWMSHMIGKVKRIKEDGRLGRIEKSGVRNGKIIHLHLKE